MTDVLRGDPASCSQTGGALRQLAARLRVAPTTARRQVAAQAPSHAAPGSYRSGPVLAQAERRIRSLDLATTTLVDQLDRVGSLLQEHATDLAETLARGRQLDARAKAAGLRVSGGVVSPAWGVTGVADGAASAALDATLAALQAELDALVAVLGRRRQRLVAVLAESEDLLAARAEELRR